MYISKTPAKYPSQKGESETDDDGGFKKAPSLPETRSPQEPGAEEPAALVSCGKAKLYEGKKRRNPNT